MGQTLLLEIGTEEMPARFMEPALRQLQDLVERALGELRLPYGTVRPLGTPRRLSVLVVDVAERQEPVTREVRGPARHVAFDLEGKPTKAAEGFARAQGISVSDLVIKATEKGEFVFAIKREEGRPAPEVLAEALPGIIRRLSFPKTMRWEATNLRFGRPIRWLVALWGETVIPFELAGVRSDRVTFGRRFIGGKSGGEAIALARADEYEAVMEKAGVIVDPQRRRKLVLERVGKAAEEVGGTALTPEELVDEVTHLVEEPFAFVGSFDHRYLRLPPEILTTVMQHHQRYFPVVRDGVLMAHFVFVCNGMPQDPVAVRRGNEKVITARFEDAAFYFAEDRKRPLEGFVPALREIVFRRELGTLWDKKERLKALMRRVGEGWLSDDRLRLAQRAAELCKADLATRLVNEFTELQGVVGRIYAELDGEEKEVAIALEDHYKPMPPDFHLPRNDIGLLLALVDRLDTLCSCFDRNIVPTGSHDPLGLRRVATTLLLLLRGCPIPWGLGDLLEKSLEVLGEMGMVQSGGMVVRERVMEFLGERLDGLLEAEGIDYDLRRAILGAGFEEVRATFGRARALQKLRTERPEAFREAVIAFTRIINILAQARRKGEAFGDEVDPKLFCERAEKSLFDGVKGIETPFLNAFGSGDFEGAFNILASLAPTIDSFFEEVLVMHEEPKVRGNRLALLRRLERLLRHFADFSIVQT